MLVALNKISACWVDLRHGSESLPTCPAWAVSLEDEDNINFTTSNTVASAPEEEKQNLGRSLGNWMLETELPRGGGKRNLGPEGRQGAGQGKFLKLKFQNFIDSILDLGSRWLTEHQPRCVWVCMCVLTHVYPCTRVQVS